MKKHFAGAIALVMLIMSVFCGASLAEEKKISVVTTIFPIYDWVREVVGENENQEGGYSRIRLVDVSLNQRNTEDDP